VDHAIALTGSSITSLWPLVRARLRVLCGIVLGEDQAYLLTRLEPVAGALGFASVADYLAATLAGARPELQTALVETMTTHESSFFRDPPFWDTLRARILPRLTRLDRPIQIWSAACSSGQEPYSLSILLKSEFPALPFEIWATDIAEETLQRARKGTFAAIEIQRGLPPALREAYFTPADGGFRVIERVREPIRFDTYNLLGTTHPLRRFDLIFCRNVLVYFDDTSREQVMRRLAEALTPEGWLGLGSTELPVRDVAGLARMPQGGGWLERST